MMFNYFKKHIKQNNLPEFWIEYLLLFKTKQDQNIFIDDARFVILDVESTGFNSKKDKILSIGAVKVSNNQIDVSNTFELFLNQVRFNPDAVLIHGIRKNGNNIKESEQSAIRQLIKYIGNDIIVGHSINFDIEIINETLKNYVGDNLKNNSIDTINLYKRLKGGDFNSSSPASLDSLANEFNIPMSDRHNAAGDSLITAVLFMKLVSRLKKRGVLTVGKLMKAKRVLM